MGDKIRSFRDLKVYQAAFSLQQEIFETSKGFPKEEIYSLTDQIRRSSRSIGANLAEAWQKRRYPAHFVSKLSDSDGESKRKLSTGLIRLLRANIFYLKHTAVFWKNVKKLVECSAAW